MDFFRLWVAWISCLLLACSCSLFGNKKPQEQAPTNAPSKQVAPAQTNQVDPTPVNWDEKIGKNTMETHADRIGAASIDTLVMGGPSTSPKIADYLTDPSLQVRLHAVEALAQFGKQAEPAVPKILEFLRNGDPNIRFVSAKTLVFIGSQSSVDGLERALKDPDPRVKIWAHAGLAKVKGDCEDHAEELAELLTATQGQMPGEAAQAFLLLACSSSDEIQDLVKALGHPDENVRVAAARVIGHIGTKAASAVPGLIGMLGEKSFRQRQAALLTLARMKEKAVSAVPLLQEFLKDPAPRFRELAAYALGCIGPLAISATEALKKATLDPDETVQAAARRALALILKDQPIVSPQQP